MQNYLCWSLLLMSLFVHSDAFLHQSDPPAAQSVSPPNLYGGFLGNWTGELEYRDFQTDQRVKRSTWLDVTLAPDGRGVLFHYIYDDGPGKVVEEASAIVIESQTSTYTVSSDRERSKDTYKIDGLEKFLATGLGTLHLSGTREENAKKVDVRITIELGRNFYRYAKETRLAGDQYRFRDGYDFTRREPPVATH